MSQQTFLVLTALADGPLHGYGIVGTVKQLSGGRVQLRVGTLYGVLDRLTTDGLVEPDREEVRDGRLRRYYRLTDSGMQALAIETQQLQSMARAAGARLRARGFDPLAGGGAA